MTIEPTPFLASSGPRYHPARMPERSFGRSVRYRRTKLGLSQAQLGELVGRSASSIRSWERDVSTPTDTSVLLALSAILDLDQQSLFEKAGVEVPPQESHPTVEEALASLAPLPIENPIEPLPSASHPPRAPVVSEAAHGNHDPVEVPLDPDLVLEAEVREHLEAAAEPVPMSPREPEPDLETFSPRPEPVGANVMRTTPEPAFVSPPEPFQVTAPTPPLVEPSYMEDTDQRQMYRVRNLATVVLFVGLVIVLLWSLSNTVDALGSWWDDFVGVLRL